MNRLQVVLCGLGGQGIVFATRVLAEAARLEGLDAICSEFKGMAQRRASVISCLKIGGFASAAIRRGGADVAICLDGSELEQALSFVKPGGLCVANASAASSRQTAELARDGVSVRFVPAGSDRSSNMTLLGAAGVLPPEAVRRAIEGLSPPQALRGNLDAFDRGLKL